MPYIQHIRRIQVDGKRSKKQKAKATGEMKPPRPFGCRCRPARPCTHTVHTSHTAHQREKAKTPSTACGSPLKQTFLAELLLKQSNIPESISPKSVLPALIYASHATACESPRKKLTCRTSVETKPSRSHRRVRHRPAFKRATG